MIQGVLTVGNAVNVGTAYGNAQGIKLDSLLKLADVKVCPLLCRGDSHHVFMLSLALKSWQPGALGTHSPHTLFDALALFLFFS